MKFSLRRVVAPALLTAFVALPAAGQSYDITNISLPGATQWQFTGINSNGQVAGTTAVAGQFRGFFVTQTDGTVDIGTLGGPRASARAVSGSGQVVGDSDIAPYTYHAFSWTKGRGMVDLGTLGGIVSTAVAVNDAGMVAGYSLTSGNGAWHAFSWTAAGGMMDLGSLGGDSQAFAINASGQIVGISEDSNGVIHAVLWNPGSAIKDLGLLPGFTSAKAMFIDDAGQVAGYAEAYNADGTRAGQHAFAYSDASGLVDLGTLGGGFAWPVKTNASGRVIGISTTTAANSVFDQHGFTWTPSEGLTDLTLGGRGSEVFDVSSTGQVVGWSNTAAGTIQHAFSWTKSGGMVDLGTFGGSYSQAYSVNKWGQVVGMSALPDDYHTHAFLYDGASVKDVNDLVRNKPAGMEFLGAGWLSDSKSMIAGTTAGLVLLSPQAAATSPPAVGQITANDPVAVGAPLSASANFTDAAAETHTATITFGDGSSPQSATVSEANGSGTASGSHTFSAAGIYPVTLAVTDNTGLKATVSRDVVVYDPAYGFVTGSGWFQSPAGAYKPDPAAVGRAMFTFVSKYQKGAKIPTGTTDFKFQSVGLEFHSDTYDWLVVGGARAQFKGTGSLNDVPGYRFMLTAIDGDVSGGGGIDRFRIKISHYDETPQQDVVDYDNQVNAGTEGTLSEGTAIGGGVIVIHAAKN